MLLNNGYGVKDKLLLIMMQEEKELLLDDQRVQYQSIEDGIKAHAEVYSFNIESELFNQLTKEQQMLWRKEIEQACISGGNAGVELARDIRYKENVVYIRFGEIPTDEKSKIYKGEIEVGIENGVSVYPAFKTNEGDIVLGLNLPVTKTTLYTQQHLIEYDNRSCYLVKGDYVGKDTDGQPLINNVSIIEKIDKYRVKEKKQGEQNHYIMEDIPDRLCDDAWQIKHE